MPYKNIEDKRAYQRAWVRKKRSDPNSKLSKQIERDREASKIYKQLLRLAFPEEFKVSDRKKYLKRKDEHSKWSKQWVRENIDKVRAYKRKSEFKSKYGEYYESAMLNADLRRLLCQEKQKVEKH